MRFRSNTNCQLGGECLSNGTVGERPEPSSGDHPRFGLRMFANEASALQEKLWTISPTSSLARLGQKANAYREQAEGQRLRGTNER